MVVVGRKEYKPFPGRNPDKRRRVEAAGYIPARQQISRIMNAGISLDAWKKEQFDWPSGEEPDESPVPPTRNGDFDLADATRIERELSRKHAQAERARKRAEEYQKMLDERQSESDAESESAPE